MYTKSKLLNTLSIVVILTTILASINLPTASAQGRDPIQREQNAETGKVSFIGPASGESLSFSQAMGIGPGAARPADPAMALAKRFAPEFGLQDVENSLSAKQTNQSENGRTIVKYQQSYQGVPVMGGELIVNTNQNGDLYSMNGEVSSNLSIDTQPAIDSAQAKQIALEAMAKWNEKTPEDFVATEPELWIFDENLLQPSTRPATLVWRMDVTAVDNSLPLRELMLINAQTGNPDFHFNQVDTAWTSESASTNIQLTSTQPQVTWPLYFEIALDETRGWIYGSDSTGNKIDVISTTTLQLVKSINLAAGAAPKGIALSPDGSELAIAQSGVGSILFVNPDTDSTIAAIVPNVDSGLNKPWDVIYGRAGRMYSSGSPYTAGSDYIHVIDTATHLEVSRSSFITRANPRLSIAPDYNTLYANENFSPNKLYKFDVSTDTLPTPTNTPQTSGFSAGTYIILKDQSRIFTSTGQVWSNPSDLNLSTLLTNLGATGILVELPSLGMVAVLGNAGSIKLIRTTDYSTAATTNLSSVAAFGPAVLSVDEVTLFASTEDGIFRLNVNPALPSFMTAMSGSNQTTKPSTSFGLPLKVKITNLFGDVLAGVPVTFTGPASGASVIFSDSGNNITTVNTDSNGIATSSTLTANALEGSYVVQASVASLSYHVDFQLVNSEQLIRTYTANHGYILPGALLCTESTTNCTNGSNPDADSAHRHTFGTYDFYQDLYGRDSIDDHAMPLISTVQYCAYDYYYGYWICPYPNAFWNGTQMVYGDALGFARADDVIAHELTHGVTEHESSLLYFYQSGAINESFSDLWGEYYDQMNGQGNDSASAKWLMGEDVTGSGAIRSMSNPPAYGDPDKMTSTLYNKKPYYDGYWDNGGVHSNSGVNNKAVYLMVDGGTFNGKTVTALGWEKTGAIYYEAQTNLLSSGADYSDLYFALQQACTNLIGQHGITPNDCVEARDALDAVQMNSQPVANFNPDAPMCPAGMSTSPSLSLFQDDFEHGTANWSMDYQWTLDSTYATSPTHNMFGNDDYYWDDEELRLKLITLPTGSSSFLRFHHAFAFEYYGTYFWDGAVLEYSTNNGSTWNDARPLFSAGQNYNGTIVNYSGGSALGGRSGFVGDSHGYVSSRYNLTSLAGRTVQFRWRFATDSIFDYYGWFVDDVQIYTCTGTPSVPTPQIPANNALTTNFAPLLDWSDTTSALNSYEVQMDDELWFHEPLINANTGTTSKYQVITPLIPNKTYYWRVRSLNAGGEALGWSTVWSFRTAYTPPTLVSPNTGFQTFSLRPTFDWDDAVETGVTGYTIQVSTSSTFATVAHTGNPVASTYTPTVDLPKGLLYWRVQTKGPNGPSAWSEVRSYQGPSFLPAPVLTSPANASLTTNYTPLLKWNAIIMPAGAAPFAYYQLQLDDANDFITPLIDDTTTLINRTVSQFQIPAPLLENRTYYWRVRAVDQLVVAGVPETGPWSATWSFRTAYTPPTLVSPNTGDHLFTLRPTFDWNDAIETGVTGYTIQVSTSNTFATVSHTGNSVASTYTPTINLPKGLLYWRVQTKGPNGPSAWSEVRSYQGPSTLPAPVLTAPANTALTTSYTPLLKWNPVIMPAGAAPFTYYQLQLDDANDFLTPLIDDTTTLTNRTVSQFQIPTPLLDNKTYYWRVRAVDSLPENGAWSAVRSFRTVILPPTLSAPVDSYLSPELRPTFFWNAVNGANGYTVQISRNVTFTQIIHTGSPVGTSYIPTVDLPRATLLYWRVQARGTNGPSLYSLTRQLTTPGTPPPTPTLSLPAASALITTTLPTFTWNPVAMPAGTALQYYILQVDNNADFSSPEINHTTLTTNSFVHDGSLFPALAHNTRYYWRVRILNNVNELSNWSAVREFRIVVLPPALTAPASPFSSMELRPFFDWEVPSGPAVITGYTIQFSTSNTFTPIVHTATIAPSFYTPTVDLPRNATIYWRVRTNGTNGPSAWSEVWMFTTPTNPPPTPTLSMPASNALVTTNTPTLQWNAVVMPAGTLLQHYIIQVDDNADFSSLDASGTSTGLTYITSPTLAPNTRYNWRVRAVNTLGEMGNWSIVRYFRTAILPPTLGLPTNNATAVSLLPLLDWSDVAGNTGYTLEVWKAGPTPVLVRSVQLTPNASQYQFVTVLLPNTTYFWKVKTKATNGPSLWSETFYFTTGP